MSIKRRVQTRTGGTVTGHCGSDWKLTVNRNRQRTARAMKCGQTTSDGGERSGTAEPEGAGDTASNEVPFSSHTGGFLVS